MAYSIEVLSIGKDLYSSLESAVSIINGVQKEFVFSFPPERLRRALVEADVRGADGFIWNQVIWNILLEYRAVARGDRRYLIAFVHDSLRSSELRNLFGSTNASEGFAVVTLGGREHYTRSHDAYCAYYLARYAVGFMVPELRNHEDTRACLFDKKINKKDLTLSLRGGRLCDSCNAVVRKAYNQEIERAVTMMTRVIHDLEDGVSTDGLHPTVAPGADVVVSTSRNASADEMPPQAPSPMGSSQSDLPGAGADRSAPLLRRLRHVILPEPPPPNALSKYLGQVYLGAWSHKVWIGAAPTLLLLLLAWKLPDFHYALALSHVVLLSYHAPGFYCLWRFRHLRNHPDYTSDERIVEFALLWKIHRRWVSRVSWLALVIVVTSVLSSVPLSFFGGKPEPLLRLPKPIAVFMGTYHGRATPSEATMPTRPWRVRSPASSLIK